MSMIARSRARYASRWRLGACVLALGTALACGEDDPDKGTTQSPAPAGEAPGQPAAGAGEGNGQAPAGSGDGLQVTLADGSPLQGDLIDGARRFLSIPYAKPPLGPLRWKAPVANDPWTNLRHETEFVKSCPQLADQGAPASDNEDCLYLNVWAPPGVASGAPVMVWIHGGGNFSGGTGIPVPNRPELWYDGHVFAAKQGVVLVTIQYRLGPFGFFAHPALAQEGGAVANQGLLDQVEALTWVKKNIGKFGGDPNNVTIFGESAGSADVCYHVASPKSRGLFHRAISQSGGCTIRSVGPEQTPANIGPQMVAYAEAVGCSAGADQLSCLRSKPVSELLANAMQPMPGAGGGFGGRWTFAAVLDGPDGFLPDTPQALFDQKKIAQVPYLLGSNNDEGTTFVWRATPLTSEAEYLADLQMRYGDAAPQIAALYPPSAFNGDFNAARARVVGDSGVVCSTHDTARRAANAGLPVYMYNFNVWWELLPATFKAGHAAEISHVFGTPILPGDVAMAEASAKVAEGMNAYWARFAKAGDPNGAGAPATWPKFSPNADARLELAPGWPVRDNFRTEECAFWRKYHKVD